MNQALNTNNLFENRNRKVFKILEHLLYLVFCIFQVLGQNFFYAPAILNVCVCVCGGAYSITLVRRSRTSCPVRRKNGFQAISFEYIGVLDSYFIHRYIIIKYRSSLITDKIHRLLSELWPLISVRKMVSGRYLLNTLVNWIHILYKGI